MAALTTIEGGARALEEKYQRLLTMPETFSIDEFNTLLDTTFADRLSNAEQFGLIVARMGRNPKSDPLEVELIFAVLEGDEQRYNHLTNVLERSRRLGLKVIRSEK